MSGQNKFLQESIIDAMLANWAIESSVWADSFEAGPDKDLFSLLHAPNTEIITNIEN